MIEHVVMPWYGLTVTLNTRGDQTHLAWDQEFEGLEVAAKFRPLGATANEQNFDRPQSLLVQVAILTRRASEGTGEGSPLACAF